MAGLITQLKQQIFVQHDFIVFGYGGFTTIPRGWGMDIAYIPRSAFRGLFAKRRVRKIIREREKILAKDDRLTQLFIPSFLRQLHQISKYEWHYEKCRVMFEYCHAGNGIFRRYTDFQQFVAECLGGTNGIDPIDLERLVRERIRALDPKIDFDGIIKNQRHFLTRHAKDVLKRVLVELFGIRDGEAVFEEVIAAHDGELSLDAENPKTSLLYSEAFIEILTRWHQTRMEYVTSDAFLEESLRTMKVQKNTSREVKKAKRDTIRGLKEQHKELLMLLSKMNIPIFIATDDSANFFRHFFGGISMYVAKDKEELQEYTVFGLCMYQPYQLGGVIVTHGGREYPRFWHTLTEEITHFADGPEDRETLRGHHRYSADPRFIEAYQDDRAEIAPWARQGVLGVKEWGQALTLKRFSRFTARRAEKRVRQFEATLDFDHYRPEARAAEIFAALPIIERAIGAGVARKIMPRMFAFYDQVYLPGLKAEVAGY